MTDSFKFDFFLGQSLVSISGTQSRRFVWSTDADGSGQKATPQVPPQPQDPIPLLPFPNSQQSEQHRFAVAALSNVNILYLDFHVTKNNSYLVRSHGGCTDLYNNTQGKSMARLWPKEGEEKISASCAAFYPSDNNFIALGLPVCSFFF